MSDIEDDLGVKLRKTPADAARAVAGSVDRLTRGKEKSIWDELGVKAPTGKSSASSASPAKQQEVRNIGPRLPYSTGFTQQIASGMPIIGPVMDHATAAIIASMPGGYDKHKHTWGERYDQTLERMRSSNKMFAEANPMASTGANLLGGVLTLPVAATKVGGALMGVTGPSAPARSVVGGVTGGTIGATDAALRDESAFSGGLIGTAFGLLGPAVGEGARKITNAVSDYMWPRVGPLAGQPTSNVNKLTQALEGETPASIAAARERMGPAGWLADLNTGTTNIAGALADTPGPHQGPLRQAFIERQLQQRDRIENAVNAGFGRPLNMVELEKTILRDRKDAADPLYEQWRSTVVPMTDELKEMVPRLKRAGAFRRAKEFADIDGVKLDFDNLTPQTWDYAKQALDSRIDTAYGKGDKQLAAKLINLKNQMLDQVERAPGGQIWKQARQEWMTRQQWLDQIKYGRDTFIGGRSGISKDELAEELRGLSQPEIMARIHGARDAVSRLMNATINGDGRARGIMLAPENQDKLRLLLGRDPADRLIKSLKSDEFLAAQHSNVIGNIQTGASASMRRARREELLDPQRPEWGLDLQRPFTYLPPSLRDVIRNPASILEAYKGQRQERAFNKLADVVLTPEPQLDDLVTALRNEQVRRAVAGERAGRVGNLMTGVVVGPGSAAARRRAE